MAPSYCGHLRLRDRVEGSEIVTLANYVSGNYFSGELLLSAEDQVEASAGPVTYDSNYPRPGHSGSSGGLE